VIGKFARWQASQVFALKLFPGSGRNFLANQNLIALTLWRVRDRAANTAVSEPVLDVNKVIMKMRAKVKEGEGKGSETNMFVIDCGSGEKSGFGLL
jgi:hypothetical protein